MNTDAANTKLADALAEIEEAQRCLERACQLLCPIRGAAHRWRRVGKLATRVQAEWHALNEWADVDHGLSLDHEVRP